MRLLGLLGLQASPLLRGAEAWRMLEVRTVMAVVVAVTALTQYRVFYPRQESLSDRRGGVLPAGC